MEKIIISTKINADTKLVWECYTNPKHIVNWNFATDEWCCPSVDNDMSINGIYKARMEAKDGSFGFDFVAVYKEIQPHNNFTYVMEDGREVNVFFESEKAATTVSIKFDPEAQNSLELQRDGWQAILNNFKKYVEIEKVDGIVS